MRKILGLILTVCMIMGLLLTGCVSSNIGEGDEGNAGNPVGDTTTLGDNPTPEEITAFITAKSSNPDKVVLRYASTSPDLNGQSYLRGCQEFLKVVKEEMGDEVEIQYFLNGTFGGSADAIIGGLQNKNFELTDWPLASFAEFTNAFQPLDVPYLVGNAEEVRDLYLGEAGEIMRQKCIDDTNVRVLFYGQIGMRQITNSKRPIKSPDDLKGLKIRVQNNPLHIAGMKALGCAPTGIAFSELFTALQQKTVDGQENPIETIFNFQFYDVQDYLTVTNHLCALGTMAINNDVYEGFSPKLKAAIDKASIAAEEFIIKDLADSERATLDLLADKMEIYELSSEEVAAFKEASRAAWPEIQALIGEDYFNQVINAAGL